MFKGNNLLCGQTNVHVSFFALLLVKLSTPGLSLDRMLQQYMFCCDYITNRPLSDLRVGNITHFPTSLVYMKVCRHWNTDGSIQFKIKSNK